MTKWTHEQAHRLTARTDVELATRRPDGSLRQARTIWIVRDGDRVFIRSTNGREAAWFRGALSSMQGRIHVGSDDFDVTFTEPAEPDIGLADAGYDAKYGHAYGSIVRHLREPAPRAATLEVHPTSSGTDRPGPT